MKDVVVKNNFQLFSLTISILFDIYWVLDGMCSAYYLGNVDWLNINRYR